MKLERINGTAKLPLKRFAFLACAAGLLTADLTAGTIRGRVLNETTGEYLHGAVVRVVGTDIRVSTDLEGNFTITDAPDGAQSVQVSYLGLGNKTNDIQVSSSSTSFTNFTLSEDVVELEGVRVEASLTGRSAAINQQRVAQGIKNIVNENDFGQMNDGNLGMAIRRMPGLSADTDGGTEVPRYVNIRGFDGSLNSVTLDGNRLPSSESGSPSQRGGGTAYGGAARSFALDDVPADAITNVEIVKAPTPDMDGAALGGSVNLVTKTAFERNGQAIDWRISTSYSELREEFGLNGSLTYSNLYDAFGGQGNLGISFTLSKYDQAEGFDNIDYDYLYLSPSDDDLDLSGAASEGAENDYLSAQLAADRDRTGQIAIAMNEDTEYNNFYIDRDRTGFSASFDLKVNDNTTLFFKPTYSKEKRDTKDFRHHLIMDNDHGDSEDPVDQFVSLYASGDSSYDAGNFFEFTGSYEGDLNAFLNDPSMWEAAGFNPGALVRLGGDNGSRSSIRPGSTDLAMRTTYNADGSARGRVGYEGDFDTVDIELYNLAFGGETLTKWGSTEYGFYISQNKKDYEEWETEWNRRGYQFRYERFEDNPYLTNYILENEGEVSRFLLPSQTPSSVDFFRQDELEHKIGKNSEDYQGFNFDVIYNLPRSDSFHGFIKTGIKYTQMERDYDYDEEEFDYASGFDYESYLYTNTEFDPPYGLERYTIPFVPDARRVGALTVTNPEFFNPTSEDSSNLNDSVQNDYIAEEDTLALYVMGDLNWGDLNVVIGARYEEIDFSDTGYILDGEWRVDPSSIDVKTFDERTAVAGVETRSRTYDEFLPSIHFKYLFNESLIGRLSVGRTYAKPAIKDMVGSVFVDEDNIDEGTVSVAVPNFELPTQVSDNVDLSFEYYTETGRYGAGYFRKDMTNYAFEETFSTFSYPGYEDIEAIVSRPIANTDAVNEGVEMFLDQSLSIFGDRWSAFSFSGNYTYTDSEAVYYTGRVGPTMGHSRNMYNLAIVFENARFQSALRWQYRDPFFENISISDFAEESEALAPEAQFIFDDTFMNPGTLDFEFAYEVNEKTTFFMNITNITEGINASRQGYFRYPEDSYPHERRWTFGFKGRF